mgnify:FL=1|tara:strand:- start:233 stop:553 length:321 start_codon:yes stop_codon:yes gene_type:complete
MTVYVIQEMPYRDILSAEEYGELVSIIEPGYQLYISPEPIVEKVRVALKNFNDEDYLLLIGDPSIIGIACAIACDINMGKLKVLKWDRRRERYYPIEFNIKGENVE